MPSMTNSCPLPVKPLPRFTTLPLVSASWKPRAVQFVTIYDLTVYKSGNRRIHDSRKCMVDSAPVCMIVHIVFGFQLDGFDVFSFVNVTVDVIAILISTCDLPSAAEGLIQTFGQFELPGIAVYQYGVICVAVQESIYSHVRVACMIHKRGTRSQVMGIKHSVSIPIGNDRIVVLGVDPVLISLDLKPVHLCISAETAKMGYHWGLVICHLVTSRYSY